jgi:hypothetical protein
MWHVLSLPLTATIPSPVSEALSPTFGGGAELTRYFRPRSKDPGPSVLSVIVTFLPEWALW